jgi:DNA-binding response OmpR family regulator
VDESAKSLVDDLDDLGFDITWCRQGTEALVAFGAQAPDFVVLGAEPGDIEPVSVVRTIRRFGTQPLYLGLGASAEDRARDLLFAGVTAVLRRPYDTRQLLQHLTLLQPELSGRATVSYGPITLDPAAHAVTSEGAEWPPLSPMDFELLRLLLTYADQLVPLETVRRRLCKPSGAALSTNAISLHVQRLRRRLPKPLLLLTVRGLGYRLTGAESRRGQGRWNTPRSNQ